MGLTSFTLKTANKWNLIVFVFKNQSKGNMENYTANLKGFRSLAGARLTEHTFSYNSQANALSQV